MSAAAEPKSRLKAKATIGKYRLLAEIGRGGMANVCVAVSSGIAGVNKLLVIKEPLFEISEEPELVQMFMDEARLATLLNHSNIVQTYEVGEDDGRYFISMQYLEGQPLSRIRARCRKRKQELPLDMQMWVLADVLSGLHYAHELTDFQGERLNVVHRDVSPQNVFITYDGHTKLVDFGIAKAANSLAQTQVGTLKGKLSYVSPEQVISGTVDRRSDIYSVGVLLWEAAVGKPMFKGLSQIEVLAKIAHGDIHGVREIDPSAPEEVDRICRKALSVKPEDRYQTALQMHEDIERFLESTPNRAAPHSIGKLVEKLFDKERSEVKSLIERAMRDNSDEGTLPLITPGKVSSSGSSGSMDSIDLGVEDTSASSSRTDGSGIVVTTGVSGSLRTSGDNSGVTNYATIDPPSRERRINWFYPAIAGAVGLGIGAAVFLSMSENKTNDVAKSSEPAASSLAIARSDVVDVTIEVKPEDATIFLDDALLKKGRYVGKLPRGDKLYKLLVEADGHVSEIKHIQATTDLSLKIELSPKRTAVRANDEVVVDSGEESSDGGADKSGDRPAAVYRPVPVATPEPADPPAADPPAPTPKSDFVKPNVSPAKPVDSNNPYAQ